MVGKIFQKVLIFVLGLTLFLNSGFGEEPTGKFLVADEKFVNIGSQCQEGFVQVGTFVDGKQSEIRHCIRYAQYDKGAKFLTKAYLEIFAGISQCNEGDNSGEFMSADGNRIALCVVKQSYSGEGVVVENISIVDGEICPAGWKVSRSVELGNGKKLSLCVFNFGSNLPSPLSAVCGNGIIETREQCEPALAISATCYDITRGIGEVKCYPVGHNAACMYDASNCTVGGAPKPPENGGGCFDSDPGNDIHKIGRVDIVEPDSYWDECKQGNETVIIEKNCPNDPAKKIPDVEEKKCLEGEVCREEGAGARCVAGEEQLPGEGTLGLTDCKRERHGMGGALAEKTGEELCKAKGANLSCNPEKPPSCSGLGQAWPWNWILCNQQSCYKRYRGVDLMVTCCGGNVNLGFNENAALSKESGEKLVKYLYRWPHKNPGMRENLKAKFNAEKNIYVLEPVFQNELLKYLQSKDAWLAGGVKVELRNNLCSKIDCSGALAGQMEIK